MSKKLSYIERRAVDIHSLVALFEGKRGPFRSGGKISWQCRCPAHDDRDPSLTVSQTDAGMILIHCHAQCEPSEVLAAVGLSLSDLYPDGPTAEHRKPYEPPMDERVAKMVLVIARNDRERGKVHSEADKAREREAYKFLHASREPRRPKGRR